MTEALTVQSSVLTAFEGFLAGRLADPPSLKQLRRRAMDRFAALGLPTRRQEAWRFTNVAPLARLSFSAVPLPVGETEVQFGRWSFPAARRLVFVDGRLAPQLSSRPDRLQPGITVTSLAQALNRHPARVESYLGHAARFDQQPFVALNTALGGDGAFVEVGSGVVLDEPVHLLFVSSERAAGRAAFPRTLVVAGEGSRATVVETYTGGAGDSLTCPVTELVLARGATLDHARVQDEGPETSHVGMVAASLDNDARLVSHAFSLGGGLVRTDLDAVLDGEGASASLGGLYLATGRQHVDTAIRVRHASPHCSSRELYKGIVDGSARAVFTGRIVVDPGADKTDAFQSNRNLLLSPTATVNSNPQLEILAGDVRCTHGSTTGCLDPEALFYLRTRGLDQAAAQAMLTWAFAREVVDQVPFAPLRDALAAALLAWLPGGELVREAA